MRVGIEKCVRLIGVINTQSSFSLAWRGVTCNLSMQIRNVLVSTALIVFKKLTFKL